MTEYAEQAVLVDALRRCQNDGDCFKCKFQYNDLCKSEMLGKAADMIESQYQLLEELRKEIAEKDKEIEDLKREIMTYPDEEIEREERCGL